MRILTILIASASIGLQAPPLAARSEVSGDAEQPTNSASDQPAGVLRVDVQITAIQGAEVYLDQGQEAGLAIGDRVLFTPSIGPALSARVVAVTRTSSRARLDAGQVPLPDALEIGAEGTVLTPLPGEEGNSRNDNGTGGDEGTVPEHPPWTQPVVQWEEETPLLAPIRGRKPEERERTFHGRAFTSFDGTRDRASVDSTYSALRAGIDAQLENPFGKGGGLQLDLAYSLRTIDVEDDGSSSESLERVERLSYEIGGRRGDPTRFEVGRFLHSEFPELGLIDGVESVHRFENGARVGASVGYLPEYDDHLGTGDDFALSLFGNWTNSEEERLVLGAALQKTWHKGKADRDLLIGTADWAVNDALSVRTSAWIDFFTSDDDLEDSSAALTQLQTTGTWRFRKRSGLSLSLSHLDWPQLLRNEFEPVSDQGIRDYAVTRVSARGWTPLSKQVRMSVRADRWSDEEDSGGGGSISVSARDLLWERGNFTAAVRARDARTSTLTGLRLLATRTMGRGSVSLRYDAALYDQDGAPDTVLQHTATTSWDWSFGAGWDFSLYVEARFGDDQDSQTLGLFLSRRF